jgi:putative transposase
MSRFRLLPTPEQEALLAHCRDARYVWNLAVEQQALRDFAQAMRNFFNGTHRRPTWRKAVVHEGFRQVALKHHHIEQLNRRFAQVWVPKVGWVRFRRSRPVPAGAKSYRVTRDRAGRWHVAFAHVPDPITGPGDCSVVGIDRGVVVSAALSTGELLHAPGLTPGESKRLTVLQQRLARAKRGSHRRAKTKRAVAKLKARERDQRKDWVEKTTTDLARRCDVIRVEDLDVRAMPRSARGHVAPGNRESQAVFECEACTAGRCNADVNAARNIAAGRAVTARGDLAGRRSANREPQLSTPAT